MDGSGFLDFVWVILEIVVTIAVIGIVFVLGAAAAIAAAVAAVPALLLSGIIVLIWGVAFIDALAWTWSLMSLVLLLIALAGGSR